MGEARRVEKVSVEDYLVRERESDVRHEYVDGELFAVAGASRAHRTAGANSAIARAEALAASESRTRR